MAKSEEFDFSSFTNRAKEIQSERDLLKIQAADLEKNLAVAESKVERLEEELEKTKAQLDNAKSTIVEKETIIQNIGSMLIAHLQKHKKEETPALPNIRSNTHFRQTDQGLKAIADSLGNMAIKREDGNKREEHE